MKRRCAWARNPLAIAYHDKEWGVPVRNDRKLFEFLILEGAQAGLSWDTILAKRANYRRAFHGFNAGRIALYGARDRKRLLADSGIVRNRAKVDAAITNAPGRRRIVSRPEAARLQVRRPDDHVCIHAGRGHGERPRARLLPAP
jgi:DNA-3-methyladenine glycosylase I